MGQGAFNVAVEEDWESVRWILTLGPEGLNVVARARFIAT